MNEHSLGVDGILALIPEAKGGGGPHDAYANECISMFADDAVDAKILGMKIALDLPRAINAVLPLTNDASYGWDDARTFLALVPAGGRGIVYLEKGVHNPSSAQTDCYYIRFFGFKSADVPFTGSSWMIRQVCESIKKTWENTVIIPDLDRRSNRGSSSYKGHVSSASKKATKKEPLFNIADSGSAVFIGGLMIGGIFGGFLLLFLGMDLGPAFGLGALIGGVAPFIVRFIHLRV